MKTFFLIICVLISFEAFGQIPPASRPVCAFCEADIYTHEPHKPGCPNYIGQQSGNNQKQSTSGNDYQQTADLMNGLVNMYIEILQEHFESKRLFNSKAEKLYGVEGCEDQGFVVAHGIDNYYTVWNDNTKKWQLVDPSTSTLTNIILYNAGAVCINRWLKNKWSIIDMCPGGNIHSTMFKNREIVGYDYDSCKCVAKDAPIAVGKNKKGKWLWGLVCRDPNTDSWNHTVKDVWDGFDIIPLDSRNFALGHKNNLLTLFSADGTQVTEEFYSKILPFAIMDQILFFMVQRDNKWGLIDETGKTVTPCIYNEIKIDNKTISALKDDNWIELSKIE